MEFRMTALSRACCPLHDPCPRQLADGIAGRTADRSFACEAAAPDVLEAHLDRRGVSRRGAFGLGGLAAAAFVARPPLAQAATPQSGRVFDPRALGRIHTLPSTHETVRVGAMDPAAPPALEIESGDVVHYPNTWVNWADEAKYGMPFDVREPIRKRYPQGPYSLVGPVVVRGAEPGDVVECRMLKLRPIDWGWNSAPKGVGALPAEFDQPYLRYFKFDEARTHAAFAPGVRLPLAPVQGVMAAQPAGEKPVSGILSGAYGGNIVLRELVEGSALFLPVQTPGARLWTGDSHAAQGDGVVDQTAIETAMEDLRIQYVLHKKLALQGPIAETPSYWIQLGFGADLDEALTRSLRQTLDWLAAASGLPRVDIYALMSIAGSFRVTQYAHQTNTVYATVPAKGVHAMVPKSVFQPEIVARISRALRPGA
jgi:acetamidase/formamidase